MAINQTPRTRTHVFLNFRAYDILNNNPASRGGVVFFSYPSNPFHLWALFLDSSPINYLSVIW